MFRERSPALWIALTLPACTGKTIDDTAGVGVDCAGDYDRADLCTAWMMNTSGETAAVLQDADGSAPLVNIQSVSVVEDGGADYAVVVGTGLPSYALTLSADDLDALNSRPRAASDFAGGATSASVGDVVEFGTDIGYNSNSDCNGGAGDGYWPPGPVCAASYALEAHFPLNPTPGAEDCETGLATIGLFVNGVSIFNWSDGFSFDDTGVWDNLAPKFEVYDGDVCGGHAAAGVYHHHSTVSCLTAQLGDDGSGHSPIYGFAADGYPIYGPWYAAGERTQSCWKTRDYDDVSSETGCGEAGARTCLLVDNTDPSQGTVAADAPGPYTSEIVTSLSSNTFVAVSGFFYQDWYFDQECAARGGAALDSHNGHDHDGLGYHYHVTDDFPYLVGPTFYGELADNALTTCGATLGGAGGGGGPGGGAP